MYIDVRGHVTVPDKSRTCGPRRFRMTPGEGRALLGRTGGRRDVAARGDEGARGGGVLGGDDAGCFGHPLCPDDTGRGGIA